MAFFKQTYTVDEDGVTLDPSTFIAQPSGADPTGSFLVPESPEVRVGPDYASGYALTAGDRFTWSISLGSPELWTDTGQTVDIDVLFAGLSGA